MDIDISQPFSHQLVIVNKLNHLVILCAGCHRQVLQESQYFPSIFKVPAGKFTNNEGVTKNLPVQQEGFKSDCPGS